MIVAGFFAYSKVVDWQRFREIADSVGAYLFIDMATLQAWLLPACTQARSVLLM